MPDLFDNTKKQQIKQRLGFLHSYCEYPDGVRFKNQQQDEEIALFLRRHFITNLPWIIIFFLLIISPPILVPFFSLLNPIAFPISFQALILLLALYYLMVFGYLITNFLNWFYNIGIVTNLTLVDLDYSEIVNVNVATTKVTQIEDVVYKQNGFLKSFFNYGDVFAQTAGESKEFDFLRIPDPEKATTIIRDLIGRRKK